MKKTSLFLAALLSLLNSLPAQNANPSGTSGKNHNWLFSMIKCEEADEMFISDTYDAFLTLLAKREIGKGKIRFPVCSAKQNETYTIIGLGYYISPNELRGFELSIPKNLCIEKDAVLTTTVDLVVASQERKQGFDILVLKQKTPQPLPGHSP